MNALLLRSRDVNFCKKAMSAPGIVPVNKFELRLKACSDANVQSVVGTVPVNWFPFRYNVVSWVNELKSGIGPLNWHCCRSRYVRLVLLVDEIGRVPVSALPARSSVCIEGELKIFGTEPWNEHSLRSSVDRFGKAPKKDGIEPEKKFNRAANIVSAVMLAISVGIVPGICVSTSNRAWQAVSKPSSVGSEPVKVLPERPRVTTREKVSNKR